MLGRTIHLAFPRRIMVYYLLFCLGAIFWLTLGVGAVSQAVMSLRTESTCLSQLGKASSSISMAYVRHGQPGLQAAVDRLRSEGGLAYCAVVSEDRRYVAHSQPGQVGRECPQPHGEHVQWGEVERVRFAGPDARILREYRTPVKTGGELVGTLHMAVAEPHLWDTLRAAAQYGPLAVLGPLLIVAAGGVVLQRMAQPLADIDTQLSRAAVVPALAEVQLQPITARSPGALGWNRLVDCWNRQQRPQGVEQRLGKALEALRQEKSQDILNSLADGIAVSDAEGRLTFANQALAALLLDDIDPAPLKGRTVESCLRLEQADPAHPLLDSRLRGRTVLAELTGPGDGEGERRVLRVARHPLQQSQGGHVWSVRDITQQKLAEQMRNQFLDSATHELRTPLSNIKAYAETLALSEMLDVENQKEFCNVINAEATRLARFIDDLLSISSLEVGSLALELQPVNLERLLQEVIGKVRPQMEQKEIAFDTRLPEKYPQLRLDKDKFAVALINLLGNAAKYTPEGGRVALKVKVDQNRIQIDVEDSGVGISAEELPRVFDKFFRSGDPRVRQQTGTGLGLAMAYEVIRLHGGELTVQSQPDKGSTFTTTLPLS